MVEQLPLYPKVEGLSTSAATGILRGEMARNYVSVNQSNEAITVQLALVLSTWLSMCWSYDG